MIRLPLTTIELGRSDVVEYERRKRRRDRGEPVKPPPGFFYFGAPQQTVYLPKAAGKDSLEDIRKIYAQDPQRTSQTLDSLSTVTPAPFCDTSKPDFGSKSPEPLANVDGRTSNWAEDESEYVQVQREASPENISFESPHHHRRPISPSKDDFHYGGFVESSIQDMASNNSQTSSPFSPEDSSTPQNLQLPGRRVDSRPLIRSPLFISHNVSSSPERPPTVALTPRVVARTGMPGTPTVLFSQPPRRPIRRHRHQTNSFSFDSSERSSAAYEQERATSSSSNGNAALPVADFSLHDELLGSSLQSSRNPSGTSTAALLYQDGYGANRIEVSQTTTNSPRDFLFSSPQLPGALSYPFSSVNRVVSRYLLPNEDEQIENPPTSPVGIDSSTPFRITTDSSRVSSPATDRRGEVNSSPPARTAFSPMSLVRRARRLLSSHRSGSPEARQESGSAVPASRSASPTPLRQNRRSGNEPVHPTPSQNYGIYNDSLSSDTQPQTPAHLPESRHQSIYHPSYTAPVPRAVSRDDTYQAGIPPRGPQRASPVRQQRRVLRRNMHSTRGRRAASPVGMMQEGFRGLYGGRENGDEEQNWVDGVRFNNAETRLWGTRDSQNDNRNLRETPEPEDWRVGRH